MKSNIVRTFACLAFGLVANTASAVVLDFDNIPGGNIQNAFMDLPELGSTGDYLGFQFSSTMDAIDLEGALAFPYGAVSGDFGALNNNGGAGLVRDATGDDFTFDGVSAKAWDTPPNSGGTPSVFGTLSGLKNGAVVWSVSTALNGSYTFFAAQSGYIDELRMGFGDNNGNKLFIIDDLMLNEFIPTTPVPLPASLPLLTAAIGLAGLYGRRRKPA